MPNHRYRKGASRSRVKFTSWKNPKKATRRKLFFKCEENKQKIEKTEKTDLINFVLEIMSTLTWLIFPLIVIYIGFMTNYINGIIFTIYSIAFYLKSSPIK